MNAAKAIQRSRYAARVREVNELARQCVSDGRIADLHRLQAYWWWGWDISGRGGLGYPGSEVGAS